MSVVGWIHHAWRLMQQVQLDGDPPDYEWVEAACRAYNLANLCPHPKGGVDAEAALPHLLVFRANGWQPAPAHPWVPGCCDEPVERHARKAAIPPPTGQLVLAL